MTRVTHYRCFFIDGSKGFVGSDEFESVNDATAVERVTTLWLGRGIERLGFEVWQADRMVHRHAPILHT